MIKWADVEGYEGLYQVSNTGLVQVLGRLRKTRHGIVMYKGRVLSPAKNSKGYLHVSFWREQRQRSFYVHALVAKHFVDGYADGMEVNHKDCDKSNNNSWNLEWAIGKILTTLLKISDIKSELTTPTIEEAKPPPLTFKQ